MSKYIYSSHRRYINNCNPPDNAQSGTVWFDSGLQCLVVYDGDTWVEFGDHQPFMTPDAEEAIDRVLDMLRGRSRINDLADKYPLVEDALGQLEVALKLCQNLDNG